MIRMLAAPVVAVALLALAACATPAPAETSLPTVTSTSTPTTEPEATRPSTRFDLDCGTIGSLGDFGSLIGEPVAERDPIAVYASVGADLPRITYIEAMGGLNCEWSNGVGHASSTNTPESYSGVEVSILPEADAQWVKFQSYYDAVGPSYCTFPENDYCGLDVLVNGYWVSAGLSGVADGSGLSMNAVSPAAGSFFDALVAAVGTLAAPTAPWTPPTSTLALPDTCEDLISAVDVASLVGLAEELYVVRGHGGWSIWSGARVETGGDACTWATANEASVGSVVWLRGGAWAANSALPVTTAPEPPAALAIDGLAAGDSAYVRCGTYCTVDLVVGGNWVQVRGLGPSEYAAIPLSARDTAVVIATEIVSRLYS